VHEIYTAFGIFAQTGWAHSKKVLDLLSIRAFDPKWPLPSQLIVFGYSFSDVDNAHALFGEEVVPPRPTGGAAAAMVSPEWRAGRGAFPAASFRIVAGLGLMG
jgi:hypothetical protein